MNRPQRDFNQEWLKVSKAKKSLLCVGIDLLEPAQGGQEMYKDKLGAMLSLITAVAPFAAAVKINRQYVKDLSRDDLMRATRMIRDAGMLAIDDSKLADIGESNDAGLYHAAREGFDFVTYCPFPGNVEATQKAASRSGVGLIALVLMSNPEFAFMKNAMIKDVPLYQHLAGEVKKHNLAGMVVGAPSAQNGMTTQELSAVREIAGERIVLIPGIGAQAGELTPLMQTFGNYCMVNVGRAITRSPDPQASARDFRTSISSLRERFVGTEW